MLSKMAIPLYRANTDYLVIDFYNSNLREYLINKMALHDGPVRIQIPAEFWPYIESTIPFRDLSVMANGKYWFVLVTDTAGENVATHLRHTGNLTRMQFST